MRRLLGGILPLVIVGAAAFATAPAAVAATRTTAAFPAYPPGGTAAQVSVTKVSYAKDGVITITVSGSLYLPGETVSLEITRPTKSVGALKANSSGVIGGNIELPAGVFSGSHTLTAIGDTSGNYASTTFSTATTSAAVSPCTTAYSAHSSGVVLAAAYLTACASQAPTGVGPLASSGAASASSSGATQLPFTGFNAATVASIGAIAIAGGGGLVLISRRRQRAAWHQ